MRNHPRTIRQATIGIALLVLLSKGVGFFREVIIAYTFGTGIEYDTYLIAVSIPIALYSLFNYAFSNLFIPRYSYAVMETDRRPGLAALWTDVNFSLAAACVIAAAIVALAPVLIRAIAPGLHVRHLPEAVLIVRVSSIIVVLAVLEAYFRSVLNAEKRFLLPAAGPLVANLVLIAAILLFAGRISTRAILYGLVVGYLAQVVMVFVPFRGTGIFAHFRGRIFQKHTGKFFVTAVIILIIEGSAQLYAVVDRYFASSMDPGIVSALGYAYLLVMLPVAIFAYALSTALFPYLTDTFARKDARESAHLLSRGITVSLLLALPATMVLWVFSEKIVMLLFRRGEFDMQSVTYTSDLVRYFAFGLAGQFLLWILSRAYYAAKRYTILIIHVIVVIVTKLISAKLGTEVAGYIGLAASTSISHTVGIVLLLALVGRLRVRIDGGAILVYVTKVLAATAAGYAAAFYIHRWFLAGRESFAELLVAVPLGIGLSLAVAAIVAFALNVADVREVPRILRRRLHLDVDQD